MVNDNQYFFRVPEIQNFRKNSWSDNSSILLSPDSGYRSLETSPEYLNNQRQIAPRSQIYNQTQYKREHTNKCLGKNALDQIKTQREPTAYERLALFANSVPTSRFSNDLICSSSTEIKKQPVKRKNNAQSYTSEIAGRSHLNTPSCERIKIPSSLQQSTIWTRSERKYTTGNIIPTNELSAVNNKNSVRSESIVAENFNQQLYQANASSVNKVPEFYNLQPQQEQIYHSNKPSADISQEIYGLEGGRTLSGCSWENINLNNYEPVQPNNQQTQLQQQLQELSLRRGPKEGEVVIADNCNNQYQANVCSTNRSSEFYNLPPQQEQFCYSESEPSTITSQEIGNLAEEHALPGCSQEDVNLNREQEVQQQQLWQESLSFEEPTYSQYPYYTHTVRSGGEEFVTDTATYNKTNWSCQNIFKPPPPYPGRSIKRNSSLPTQAVPNSPYTNISPTSNIEREMKYETQSGPPTTPSHLTSSGVEPPHSSQTSGIVMGDSPAEVVDSLLLSPWAANGPEFLEGGVPDVKQTGGFQDTSWVDSLMLGSTVNVASAQSLMEIKGPLPAFTNYTGHLSINGISGHHYHTIASSGQRSSVPSASPTPSSNQEYYESPVVSSSTPCPQVSQKHQSQNHQQPQQQHHQHHPQNQHQQQQQLPQSTQQMEYDIDDIAEIIGSAIADTTVPGKGNGPSSEQTSDTSGDWIDIADWIMPECSPKTQETTSPNSFVPQIYVTTTPTIPTQQHAGSTLQNLLTQNYAPLLQARLQASTAPVLQNASCGETPSSTSPYPPLSPPNRVSTSCSPDDLLHSSFATPSHPRKRSRSSGSGQNTSKKNPAVNAAVLPYGAESEVVGNPKKPVHRCHICSRAFLNKSNIKVHLRTHTGEKPFKCDVCSKAFRQKAHLIKHQQIHKRGGRE